MMSAGRIAVDRRRRSASPDAIPSRLGFRQRRNVVAESGVATARQSRRNGCLLSE